MFAFTTMCIFDVTRRYAQVVIAQLLHSTSAETSLQIRHTHTHTHTHTQCRNLHYAYRRAWAPKVTDRILDLKQAVVDDFHHIKNVPTKHWLAMLKWNEHLHRRRDIPQQCADVFTGHLKSIDFSVGSPSVRLRSSFPTTKGTVKSKCQVCLSLSMLEVCRSLSLLTHGCIMFLEGVHS